MVSKSTVVQVLNMFFHWSLEWFVSKHPIFFPVSSNSESYCSWKSLVCLFFLEGLLWGGASHEAKIYILWGMVWEYCGLPEPCVGDWAIDLWNDVRLSQYHLVNRGHFPWCALGRIFYGQWLFLSPWTSVVFPKETSFIDWISAYLGQTFPEGTLIFQLTEGG